MTPDKHVLTTSEYGAALQKGQDKTICLTFKVSPWKKHWILIFVTTRSLCQADVYNQLSDYRKSGKQQRKRDQMLPFSKKKLSTEQLYYINMQEPEYLQFSVLKLLAATDMSSWFFWKCLLCSNQVPTPVTTTRSHHFSSTEKGYRTTQAFCPIKQWGLFLEGVIKFAWKSCDVKFDCYGTLISSSLF